MDSGPVDLNPVIKPLSKECRREAFRCGAIDIDKWFRSKSWNQHEKLKTRVTTAHHPSGLVPIGFHALSLQMQDDNLLDGNQRNLFRSHQRLFASINLDYIAVDRKMQGQGLGRRLLAHAMEAFYRSVMDFGVPVMTVTAIDVDTCEFYNKLGFRPYGPDSASTRMLLPAQAVIDAFS